MHKNPLQDVPRVGLIGTEKFPLSASSLVNLQVCPLLWVACAILPAMDLVEEREATDKMDTGSAAGRFVELYHRGHDVNAAGAMVETEAAANFQLADLGKALKLGKRYAADPRNAVSAVLTKSLEAKVRFSVPAATNDPTGQPIHIAGHLDQVRRDPDTGRLMVWDTKVSGFNGRDLVLKYAWQLAAYAVGASQLFAEEVWAGGIIRLTGYATRDKYAPGSEPVFFYADWGRAACAAMLASMAHVVGDIRAGRIFTQPSGACFWCPIRPVDECEDVLTDAIAAGRLRK